ncbi:hypothetical protein IW136_001405 [Coemansia sp. RSA 678]|nr:hypothetical protein IW136_001405 [Coemansia sp. RSA 678]
MEAGQHRFRDTDNVPGHPLRVQGPVDVVEQGPLAAVGQVHGGRKRKALGVAALFEFVRKSDEYKIGDRKNYIDEDTSVHYFYPVGEITAQGEINGAKGSAMCIYAHSANTMLHNEGAKWNVIFFVGHPETMPKDKCNAASA